MLLMALKLSRADDWFGCDSPGSPALPVKPGQIGRDSYTQPNHTCSQNLQVGHNFLLRADTSGSMILQVQPH